MNINKNRPTFLSYRCDECGKHPIQNHRWECTVCKDFDMCTDCYKKGIHPKGHGCNRYVIQSKAILQRSNSSIGKDPADLSRNKGKAQGLVKSIRNLYEEVQLPRKNIPVVKSDLFLKVYKTGVKKWPQGEHLPISVKQLFVYDTELLLGLQSSLSVQNSPIPIEDCTEGYDSVLRILRCVHAQITFWESETLGWFGSPVPASVPNYHNVIEEPSDLGTIYNLLENDKLFKDGPEQRSMLDLFKEYTRRMELIWQNATKFNPRDHPVHIAAKRLSHICIKLVIHSMTMWKSLQSKAISREGISEFWNTLPENFKFPAFVKQGNHVKTLEKPLQGKHARLALQSSPRIEKSKPRPMKRKGSKKEEISNKEKIAKKALEEAPQIEAYNATILKSTDDLYLHEQLQILRQDIISVHKRIDDCFGLLRSFGFTS